MIEAQGFIGIVKGIQIFNTILNTFDNKRIIIPNGAISSGAITNFTAEDIRRVDMEFGIGYGDDIKKAKAVLTSLVEAETRILKEPARITSYNVCYTKLLRKFITNFLKHLNGLINDFRPNAIT